MELKITTSSESMIIQVMPKGSFKWEEGVLFEAITATGKDVEVFAFKKDAEVLKTLLSEYGDIRIIATKSPTLKAKIAKVNFVYKKVEQLVEKVS